MRLESAGENKISDDDDEGRTVEEYICKSYKEKKEGDASITVKLQ